jgi:hypothetical protein
LLGIEVLSAKSKLPAHLLSASGDH